ncbi:MAG TPA: hypothetical protein VJR89_03790, partial [Polyangiales bacterium]|nr:hypothetical protein [Polyangiales bacterium]
KWFWVAFDIALFAGLLRWLRAPAPRLLHALALAVTADACLTVTQALLWNVRRVQSLLDAVVVVIACVMPPLAAAILWGAQRRTRETARAAPSLNGM